MENHRKQRRFVTSSSAEVDIISNLSEDLINPIFERLPVKDAVRTSVLSKNWRYRWTTMRTLDFSQQFAEKLSKNGAFSHNGFVRVINKIMIHHQGPIFKFHLCIPFNMCLDSFQEVDQWMLILSRNNVTVLGIDNFNPNPNYPIPSSVFSCLELRVLQLHYCTFNPPLEFQGFPNLEEIFFKNVEFWSKCKAVINLPQLKKLTLQNCKAVDYFNIKAVRLRTLNVFICRSGIHIFLPIMRCQRLNLGMMLRNLPNLAALTIDGYVLKFLAVKKFPKLLPHQIKCLMELEFHRISFGDLDQLQGALCMLRNSPNLKVLRVTLEQMGPEDDLELTSNYLETPDCLDQTLLMLQTVEMTSLEGSRPELLFIKLLLNHSPHLEKMVIQPRAEADVQKMFKIAKDVMLFPRASTKAKMVYMDPEP